jgi:hypothetical protein
MSVSPLAPAAGGLHPVAPDRRVLSGSRSRAPRRRALAFAALLAVPSSAWALEAEEVVRYDLYLGLGGYAKAAVASDGHVLLAWYAVKPAQHREVVLARWLAPDGTPLGDSFEVARWRGLVAVAARPGRQGLVISRWASYRESLLTVVNAAGVVRRRNGEELGCDTGPVEVTAPEAGYFLACGGTGWWLSETGRPRQGVDLGTGDGEVALAGGSGRSVVAVYGQGARLRARWMTPWQQGPTVELDDRFDLCCEDQASIEHLGDRVFGVAWVRKHERSADPEDGRRVTAVHAATFRAPDRVRSSRRFSGLAESVEAATGEQRRPHVLRTAAAEQVVAWFRCAYVGSPGGLACFERDGLFLRACVAGRPAGKILEIADVAAGSQVLFTGERLLTLSPLRKANDRYYLEVRGFVLE